MEDHLEATVVVSVVWPSSSEGGSKRLNSEQISEVEKRGCADGASGVRLLITCFHLV